MLNRIRELIDMSEDFAFETTLSTRSYIHTVDKAKKKGYNVILLFFWLQQIDLAIERVRERVKEGGHNIPEDVIRRRYHKGINNLFNLYLPIVDTVLIFDNSEGKHDLIAEKIGGKQLTLLNHEKFKRLKLYYEL